MSETLVNIFGLARSGSTMLDLMLGHSDNAFSCGEVYAFYRPWRKAHLKIECVCMERSCPVWRKLKHAEESTFHSTVVTELGAEYVIDSSKKLSWVVDCQEWARNNGMVIVNLLLWKDPVDLFYSHWKRNRSYASFRRYFLRYYGRVISLGIPFCSVSFNELVANPEDKLRAICEKIGMEYFEGKERFWEDQHHHHLFGSGGVRAQVIQGESEIRDIGTYEPEFQRRINTVQERLANDGKIQSIMQRLKKFEIERCDVELERGHIFSKPSVLPWWYYRDWCLRPVRRVGVKMLAVVEG